VFASRREGFDENEKRAARMAQTHSPPTIKHKGALRGHAKHFSTDRYGARCLILSNKMKKIAKKKRSRLRRTSQPASSITMDAAVKGAPRKAVLATLRGILVIPKRWPPASDRPCHRSWPFKNGEAEFTQCRLQ
jgi:hypothetical protein